MSEMIMREDSDGIAYLTLNRPDKLNTLTIHAFEELDAHLGTIAQQTDEVGLVVIRGAGKCFSAGHDLGDLSDGEGLATLMREAEIVENVERLPQPVVMAVHSHCYTGALELALAGDIILASETAKFADTHARFALTPFWGMSQRLPRRIGRTKAAELSYTARTIGAEEALSLGLCNHVYKDDSFADDVEGFCRTVLENSWFSLRAYKKLMRETDGLPLEAGLAHEIYKNGGFGPDMDERIDRFLKK